MRFRFLLGLATTFCFGAGISESESELSRSPPSSDSAAKMSSKIFFRFCEASTQSDCQIFGSPYSGTQILPLSRRGTPRRQFPTTHMNGRDVTEQMNFYYTQRINKTTTTSWKRRRFTFFCKNLLQPRHTIERVLRHFLM